MKQKLIYLIIFVLGLFALLTLFLSSSVIFDLFGIREREGNYVPIVVWANFISSLLYLTATYGLLKKKIWAAWLLGISVVILAAAFAGLQLHIKSGALYETKTIYAMIFRMGMTLLLTIITYRILKK